MRLRGAALALLLALGTVSAQKIARDWSTHPAIVQIDAREDIFAVGDVHGDYDRLVKLLAAAKIIHHPANPGAVQWIAGKAVLVFTGDLIDKGPHSLKVLDLANALGKSAAASGGRVVTIMGNHEAEFLADPNEKKVREFAHGLRSAGLIPGEIASCKGEVGQFLCGLPFGARIGNWFFSHGGNTGGRTIPQLVADFTAGVTKEGFGSQQLVGANSMLEARIGKEDPAGNAWFEVESPKRNGQQLLTHYVAALRVSHLVQGHQHQAILFDDGEHRNIGEMFQWHGLLFLIDVGMSEGVGDSPGAVLHIHSVTAGKNEEASAICANGRTVSIWNNLHGSKSGAATPCVSVD